MRILVTGSRDWVDRMAIMTALGLTISEFRHHEPLTLVHGGARGADRIADEIWRMWMVQLPRLDEIVKGVEASAQADRQAARST